MAFKRWIMCMNLVSILYVVASSMYTLLVVKTLSV